MSKIIFTEEGSKPPAPSVGQVSLYVKTDEIVYIQDSAGTEIPLGSAASITQLTGDVTAIGPGISAAAVVSVGGASASDVAAAVTAYLAATPSNTPNTLVERDSSGNFIANIITAALNGNADTATTSISFTGSLSGDVTGTQGATVVSSVGGSSAVNIHSAELLANAATALNTSSTIVKRDVSGNFAASTITANLSGNATTSTNSTNFTGSLSGDVSGTQSTTSVDKIKGVQVAAVIPTDAQFLIYNSTATQYAPQGLSGDVSMLDTGVVTVGSVGGSSAVNLHSAELAANAATPLNTAYTIVERDGSGNFAAGIITANLTGNVSGTASNVTGIVAVTNGGTNSSTALNNNRIMESSGGAIVEAAAITPARALISDANGIPTQSVTTDTELSYVSGVTSSIQTQLNSISGSAITALTSDVSATGPGSVPATVNSVGGSSAANIHSAELAANAATSANTPSTIVKRDSSGNFSAGTITASLSGNATTATTATNFSGSLSGDVTGTQSSTVVAAIQNHSVSNTAPTDAQILIYNNGTSKYTPESVSGDIAMTDLGATTIQNNVVSNAKLAQMPANTLKGNNTGSPANASDLTVSQVNVMLGSATSIGALDAQPENANGLALVGNVLSAQSADATHPGMVNNTIQTMSGNKTFSGQTAISNTSTTALTVNSTSLVVDATNNSVGIGIQPATNAFVDAVNSTAASKTLQLTGYGTGSTVGTRGRFARGTSGSPAAAQNGDIINFWSARGYGTSQFAAASTAAINAVAAETFTNSSNQTYLQFSTTPTGSVTSAEAMRVASAGNTIGPQSGSTAIHQINGGWNRTTRTLTAATLTVDTTTTDDVIYTDSTSNAITITLPTATNGRVLFIQDKTGQASTNHVTITPPGSVTINGVNASIILGVNYGGWVLTSDGTNWSAYRLVQLPSVQALSGTAIDWSTVGAAGGLFTKILSANTTFTFSNATAGQTIVIRLTNTASNYTVTWPTIKWPVQTTPVQTTGAFSDVYTIVYDGSTYYGSYVQNF